MSHAATVHALLDALRQRRPLVHNITNFVVMNSTANALLSLGASPIMAHAEEELEELLGLAGALVLNIGTLSPHWIAGMRLAARLAAERGLPVALDPVGAGASRLRTATSLALANVGRPAVIRGNASEIMALAGAAGATKGVDSVHGSDAAEEAARTLARTYGCVAVASGAVDFLTDGERDLRLSGGSPLTPQVTGMGCAATAIVGAFLAVADTPMDAALAGMGVMKVAAEMAADTAAGPGSFEAAFRDALHRMGARDLDARLKAA
ncbi:MAG: hydroxyethylthiazole kinase [Thermodesulfobacteriota bacterium]